MIETLQSLIDGDDNSLSALTPAIADEASFV